MDGAPVRATSFVLEHPRYGRLQYGPHPRGYDTWTFVQSHGGVVVLPFALLAGRLLVGLIHQLRENQGGYVWNSPRGFIDAGESAIGAAGRELLEEAGIHHSLVALDGEPANPDSAFFSTATRGSGVHFFGAEISPTHLSELGQDEWEYVGARRDSDANEHIRDFRFMIWTRAAVVGDMFTNAAVARLLAWLTHNGRISLSVERTRSAATRG